MKTHELKIKSSPLKNLLKGKKKSEIRYNDRNYQVNDILKFYNADAIFVDEQYLYFKITHIHSGLGLRKGYICLSVEKIPNRQTRRLL